MKRRHAGVTLPCVAYQNPGMSGYVGLERVKSRPPRYELSRNSPHRVPFVKAISLALGLVSRYGTPGQKGGEKLTKSSVHLIVGLANGWQDLTGSLLLRLWQPLVSLSPSPLRSRLTGSRSGMLPRHTGVTPHHVVCSLTLCHREPITCRNRAIRGFRSPRWYHRRDDKIGSPFPDALGPSKEGGGAQTLFTTATLRTHRGPEMVCRPMTGASTRMGLKSADTS